MKVNYKYASPSRCMQAGDKATLGLSPDLSRDEKVSFSGKLKHPLLFRDAMLMLREIVISDTGMKTKERPEYFEWLDQEIERRINEHKEYMPNVREALKKEIDTYDVQLFHQNHEIKKLLDIQKTCKNRLMSMTHGRIIIKLKGTSGNL